MLLALKYVDLNLVNTRLMQVIDEIYINLLLFICFFNYFLLNCFSLLLLRYCFEKVWALFYLLLLLLPKLFVIFLLLSL